MCLIITSEGAKFKISELEEAQDTNSDGFGVAWIDGGLVHWRKFPEFRAELWKQPSGPVICHFRMATAGGVCVELAHPFPVSRGVGATREGSARKVLFHNGHLQDWEREVFSMVPDKRRSGPWSDSRAMAFGAYRSEDSLHSWAKRGQRFATLSAERGIVAYGEWAQGERDGIERSNKHHLWDSLGGSFGGSFEFDDDLGKPKDYRYDDPWKPKDYRYRRFDSVRDYRRERAQKSSSRYSRDCILAERESIELLHEVDYCSTCYSRICYTCWGNCECFDDSRAIVESVYSG